MPSFFLHYKHPLAIAAVVLLLGGGFAYGRLKTALFPEITFPKIKIIADAGQQPVDKMMLSVTRPLEEAVKQVPGLKTVHSRTSRGSCEISAFMDWKADIDLGQERIESRIAQIRNNLPPEVQVSVEKMNPSILPVIGYTLESDGRGPVELKHLATYTIKPFLSQVDGVSEVRVIGGKEKEYWVLLDAAKMGTLGITPALIATALDQTNFITSNGYLTDFRYLYLTVTDAAINTIPELEQVVIRNDGRRVVLLKDIAAVRIAEAKEYIKINANGRDGILLAVVKQPDANLIEVSENMARQLADVRKTLPPDVRIQPYYVQADFVNASVRSVRDALWAGLALAIIVAMLFLRSFKASVTILLTIPLTLSAALMVLFATGATFNIMTLGAIAAAIGLIIDDAIVVVEQIHRAQEEQPERPVSELLPEAIRYLFPAMLGSSVSTTVIFLPFALMSGVAGAYFKVMTDTMVVVLVCSFFVTWLLLPVLYLLLTRRPAAVRDLTKEKHKSGSHPVQRRGWVAFFIRRPWISLLCCGVLAFAIYWVLPQLETGFLPEMDEGSIVLDYQSPYGASLEETDRILREVEKILVKIPEVETYSRRTGTEMGFFITEPNSGDYLIQLKPDRQRTTEEVIDDIRGRVEATQPALTIDFGQVVGDMLGDLMSSAQPIEIKIFGNDQSHLQELARQVAAIAEQTPGTADVFDGIVIAGPSVSMEPKAVALAQFGLTPADLQYQLQTALEGNVAGQLFEKEKRPAIRLLYPGSERLTVEDIRRLQIFLPGGKRKPITELASVQVRAGDTEIERENLQMMGVVTARLDQRDLGGVMRDLQQTIRSQVRLPAGYHITYGGAWSEQQQSFQELLMILLAASLLVFGVMLFLFRRILVALAILLVSVLGIAGSYLLLYWTHTPLNVGSYTGLIMIVGIIGENAIFTFRQYAETRRTTGVDESLVYAISTRLRPKLMTAFGAIIALLPLAMGIGTGAQLHRPLAIAVIGGLLAALPLLLVVLPTLLRLIFRESSKK